MNAIVAPVDAAVDDSDSSFAEALAESLASDAEASPTSIVTEATVPAVEVTPVESEAVSTVDYTWVVDNKDLR